MSEPILFVDDTPKTLDLLVCMFAGTFDVHAARSPEEALSLCESRGPFAVVLSDYQMPGTRGSELLARIHARSPQTVSMLLTGMAELDMAVEALHQGGVFRLLEKPCSRASLAAAIDDALAEHRRRVAENERVEAEASSRATLQQQNGHLEHRIHAQMRALSRLQHFVGDLNSCETLERVAEATAQAACEVCGLGWTRVEFRVLPRGMSGVIESTRGERSGLASERVAFATAEGELGALECSSADTTGRALDATDHELLASIAASASVAARNVLRRCERDEAQQATIFALAKLAEQRDNETGRHLERVSAYCRMLSIGLREDGHFRAELTDAWIAVLEKSAPLHDIGKVGIPDQILLKPGKLDPEEWETMRQHTTIGADTLRSVIASAGEQPFLMTSLEIAWCHHERWDGGGYPRGIRGDAIPLSARILALADVYDALTSERPYKPAWTHAAAIEAIARGSGTHFDPRVVSAFLGRGLEFDRVRAQLADDVETGAPILQLALPFPRTAAG
ncbi:MAG: HD domain-containing protein [Planctomycetes bacterium]|nr:HD domain-containing protein [Planctomycetota bacterium]